MSTTYEIRTNHTYNSNEVYFDGKPCEAVREALKALKFRWNSVKKCWYGYASDFTISATINEATPEEEQNNTVVTSDGYMGGGAVFGSKSHLGLYGQELKKAIAEDIKRAGIKGVTLSEKRGNIYATIKTTEADILPFEEFKKVFEINYSCYWINYFDDEGHHADIHINQFMELSVGEKEKITERAAAYEYYKEAQSEITLNEFCLEKYKAFSPDGTNKIQAVNNIIKMYNFDESNSMVDYFHTNFYYWLVVKTGKKGV